MLLDLVKKNRSYRGYDHSRKITGEELLSFVEAARLCPSSVNVQPLKYFLACEEGVVAAVQAETNWAKGLPDLVLPHPGKEPTAFIVICQDLNISDNLARFQRDVGIVAQTMLLAAVEQGLGGCMIGNFKAGPPDAHRGVREAGRGGGPHGRGRREDRLLPGCGGQALRAEEGAFGDCSLTKRKTVRTGCEPSFLFTTFTFHPRRKAPHPARPSAFLSPACSP